tara:strand:+ start:1813 stop:2577 length:765 start_codon:yes stop_codon:yes gene_type:complete
MKFTVSAKELEQAIESIRVKGKSLTSKGFGNGTMGDYIYIVLEGNVLSIINGSAIFMAKISLPVAGEENGNCVLDATVVLPYLKSFKDNITVAGGDFISISQTGKRASLPKVVNHPAMDALENSLDRTKEITWSAVLDKLPTFGKTTFEGAFSLTSEQFKSCIKNCELVKSGVYRLDFNKETATFSSQQNVQNRYTETITPIATLGEAATLDYTSPLQNFFDKEQLLNFYVKDDFPLLIVAEDRMILKAPQIGD